MTGNDNQDDPCRLIKDGYSAPQPRKQFVEGLKVKLCRELQSATGAKRAATECRLRLRALSAGAASLAKHWRLSLTVAACVAATVIITYFAASTKTDEGPGDTNKTAAQPQHFAAQPQHFASDLALRMPVHESLMATEGTFEGFYHRDRWGVGHFRFFIVNPELHARLAKHEGRRLRVVVERGEQRGVWNTVNALKIGQITPLADSPLKLRLRTLPKVLRPSKPCQLICELVNTGKEAVRPGIVMVVIRRRRSIGSPDAPSYIMKAYTQGQLAVDHQSVQMSGLVRTWTGSYGNLSPQGRLFVPVRPNQTGSGELPGGGRRVVPPGDILPHVILLDKGLPAGEYELLATVTEAKDAGSPEYLPESRSWLSFDVSDSAKAAPAGSRLLKVLSKSVVPLEDGYELRLTVASPDGGASRIAQFGQGERAAWAGRLRAFAADGSQIPLALPPSPRDHAKEPPPWRLRVIPAAGVEVKVRFRQNTRFAGKGIHRLVLDILTDKGVETLVVADGFEDVHLPAALPPFGQTVDGVKLRVRPAKASFKKDEPLKFYLQAVNTTGKPVTWWIAWDWLGENAEVAVDGKAISLPKAKPEYISGWAGKRTVAYPKEKTFVLPKGLNIKPGKHTLRYSLTSNGGTYMNASNRPIPLLRGKLVSQEVHFVVE